MVAAQAVSSVIKIPTPNVYIYNMLVPIRNANVLKELGIVKVADQKKRHQKLAYIHSNDIPDSVAKYSAKPDEIVLIIYLRPKWLGAVDIPSSHQSRD